MNLVRSFSVYTIGTIASSAVPLALLPVLTRYLTEAEYGTLATLTTLIAFLTPPLMWGIATVVSVEFFRQPPDVFRLMFSSLIRVPAVALVVLAVACALTAPMISSLLDVPGAWFTVLPVFAALNALPTVMSALLRMRDLAVTFACFQFFSAVIGVTLSIFFVVALDLHWQGRMLAIGMASLLGSIVALHWLQREGYLGRDIDRQHLRNGLRFGAGVVPHELGSQAIRMLDRLFLVAMVGLPNAGQYAVATQVASVMLILLSAFNRAWSPYLFSQLQKRNRDVDKAVVNKSYLVIAIFLVFLFGFNLVVPIAYGIFIAPKFHPSMGYVSWLTLGHFFTAVYLTYIDYVFYVRKTHVLAAITMFNLACNLVLNYVLIARWGAVGAAYAFAGSMFLVMIVAFAASNRLYPMPWFHWARRQR